MAGAAATTYYDVITRYRMDTGRSERELDRVERRARSTTSTLSRLGRSFSRVFMVGGGITGSILVGYGIHQTFRNLNEEMNRTISTAAMLNKAFEFSPDPAANFVSSMTAARDLVRDIIKDAAKLPGESRDYFGILSAAAGPAFVAGASTQQMRRLVANTALTSIFSETEPIVGGSQLARMLTGGAGREMGLFRFLQAMEPGLIGDTQTFNLLPAQERLRRLDEAMQRIAGNDLLRGQILRTFDTQLGTLKDNLFGVSGVLGRLGADPFEHLLDGLTRLNKSLEENADSIVEGMSRVGDSIHAAGVMARMGREDPYWSNVWANTRNMLGYGMEGTGVLARESLRYGGAAAMFGLDVLGFPERMLTDPGFYGRRFQRRVGLFEETVEGRQQRREMDRYVEENLAALEALGMAGPMGFGGAGEGRHRELGTQVVHQVFHIRVDAKSDVSPEAIARRISKEIAHEEQARRKTRIHVGPGAATGRP